mmetsp:Transcript_17259/g.47197  ORF Transcript_17259/g.47197 Transcript_17259/m.47197 type:complete len:209 (-) Transcript_17259:161-787(-)
MVCVLMPSVTKIAMKCTIFALFFLVAFADAFVLTNKQELIISTRTPFEPTQGIFGSKKPRTTFTRFQSSNEKQSTSKQDKAITMDYVKILTDYLALYDGKVSYDEVKDKILNFFHPDLVVETSSGGLNYEEWTQTCKGMLEKKVKAELVSCKLGETDGTVEYTVRMIAPGGEETISTAIGTFQDGKFVKVAPIGEKVHSGLKDDFGGK